MSDNEIIKALQCIGGNIIFCQDCPYSKIFSQPIRCKETCAKDAIDLISRQKAEIANYERLVREWDDKLTQIIEGLPLKFNSLRAEAIKGFAERLKSEKVTHKNFGELVYVEDIENLVKEMVGEQE